GTKLDKGHMSTAAKVTAKRMARARVSKRSLTRHAAQVRARCNLLSQAERERLMERAMQLAHGADAQPAKTRRR
ncbi:MAG: hypothetical protein N3I86_16090, partial [Verrucomicrobiae bacterium]|nr:hypothetical protein [Verrucomicrobiae bacterium]